MTRALIGAITLYQLLARGVLPRACRFAPSCSDYAKEALSRHGLRGLVPAARRLARCHPFHSGGWDPVAP